MSYQVVWRGFVGGSTGYDRASREYLLALDRLGVDVKVEAMTYGNHVFIDGLNPAQVARIKELMEKPYAEDKPKVLIYHAQPNGINIEAEREKFDKIIILTVWETTRVPQNWIEPANGADAIIVPSKQNIDALLDSGIKSDVYLAPHGADYITFNMTNTPLKLKNIDNTFTFLSVFQWQHRKAPEALLEAYWSEFTSADNVSLVIKTYWGHVVSKAESRVIIQQVAKFKELIGKKDTAPIYLTTSLFDDDDLKGLYTASDCFVLPSRGEGVGLPYIEALCSGIPVIATDWGGSKDFLNESNSYPVGYTLMPTNAKPNLAPNFNQLFTPDMEWAEPDIESLRFQMRSAYENQEEAKAKGINGRHQMEKMTWDESGKALIDAIEKVFGK